MSKLEMLIAEHIENVGFGRVSRLDRAYYILSDGTFLGCNYDCGSRGDDHRAIFSCCDYDREDWEALHKDYSIIRYVPESDLGLISVGQELTPQQEKVIERYNLEIEEY